jgi:sec-independent protein translocase protein TatC
VRNEEVTPVDDDQRMPFLSHLIELRRRVIASLLALSAGGVACFLAYDPIAGFLMAPLEGLGVGGARGELLYATSIFEAFMVKFKVSLIAGFIVTFPFHAYNCLRFVFPGLRPRERRIIGYSLSAALVLTLAGFYFGYYRIIPAMVGILTAPSLLPARIGYLLGYERNLFFLLDFLLVMLVVFQLPLILEVLLILNVLKRKAVFKAGRYVIVGILVLAAIVTPSPDMVSQLMVAIPLTALYFIAILAAKIFRFGEG